jgi:SAM-dependent methyltransferase
MKDKESRSTNSWEQPDRVARFAACEADLRLQKLLPDYGHAADVTVLDLGCAGGRNAVLLAEQGFDVFAFDSSTAMVVHTRERLTSFIGSAEACRRVVKGDMADLRIYPEAMFDLVVALGIYHCSESLDLWQSAVAETSRVLKPRGRLLLAHFTPDTDPTGEGVRSVPQEPHVYTGFGEARHILLERDELDKALANYDLIPIVPSEVVRHETQQGRRVTVNGYYEKRAKTTSQENSG